MTIDLHTLLALIFGMIILVLIIQAFNAANNLWTSLVSGSIVAAWYRQRCITDEVGLPTGAYQTFETIDGKTVRKPVDKTELEALEEEAEEKLTEKEDQDRWGKRWRTKYPGFWNNY